MALKSPSSVTSARRVLSMLISSRRIWLRTPQKALTKATKGEATFKWHFDMSGEKALLFYLWRNRDNIFLISAEIAVINML